MVIFHEVARLLVCHLVHQCHHHIKHCLSGTFIYLYTRINIRKNMLYKQQKQLNLRYRRLSYIYFLIKPWIFITYSHPYLHMCFVMIFLFGLFSFNNMRVADQLKGRTPKLYNSKNTKHCYHLQTTPLMII